ncbi:MAG: 1-acyl-sn-glycerol-3-phosphate acyltransferase [Nanoarchaeota archaeon]|nr:1-acyl-sn-glycerol-3-phosphate acyltransferase [Nanoarchaeota archaeon]MBU1269072.1 1-acyl-sn-glycerol-3-phosphate acyltransferase [Nanoarchaeota archaeon]MBU1604725.1 1-acyl-sn-glycerol-3-phosphate acyltransferase [Nanoarchaeota archaeon]MBU2442977.1 1-acyl-sn-glycerol-3-phosphate acyltransferase [Nanoarchaeota archaeon]
MMKKQFPYYLGMPLSAFTLTYKEVRTIINSLTPHFIDLKVNGAQNIPKEGPGIIAANHESYLDILLQGCIPTKRHLRFVAKKELWESEKFYGQWLRKQVEKGYAMPVDRRNATPGQIKEFMYSLDEGHILSIFPEGTRKKGGAALSGFHNLVAMLSYGKDIPVIPVGIIRTMYAQKKLLNDTHPRVEINIGEPVYCKKTVGEDKKESWNSFNKELRSKVSSLMRLEEKVEYFSR